MRSFLGCEISPCSIRRHSICADLRLGISYIDIKGICPSYGPMIDIVRTEQNRLLV